MSRPGVWLRATRALMVMSLAGSGAVASAQAEGEGLRLKGPAAVRAEGSGLSAPGFGAAVASLQDTMLRESSSRVQFFYVEAVGTAEVPNAFKASRDGNAGRGLQLGMVAFSREVPPGRMIVSLVGRVAYGAPIEAMLNSSTMYKASRRMAFTPEAGRSYLVKGELSAARQEVWLEDDGGERVGTVIEPGEDKQS